MTSATPITLGFLYPGHSAEDDYPLAVRNLRPAVTAAVVHTTVDRDTHEIDALRDTGADWRLAEGAERLRAVDPAVVVWACTSGSFVFGLEGARAQAARIGRQLGVPASSTSLAFVAAAEAIGLRRVAVGATYPSDLADLFRVLLEDAGIGVTGVGTLGIMDASDGGRLDRDAAIALARDHDHPAADAVLLPDTALHTVAWLGDLEAAVGKPVLTANQVTVWDALRLAQHPAAAAGPRGAFGLR